MGQTAASALPVASLCHDAVPQPRDQLTPSPWHRLSVALPSCHTQILSPSSDTALFGLFSSCHLSLSSAGEAGGAGKALGRNISADLHKRHLPVSSVLGCCEWPFLPQTHHHKLSPLMFSMGSSRGFHYCSYHSDKRSRSLIWLKSNHQAKIRSKFPLVTKTTNQANYFGLTNFGVLTQIPGSSVVVVTGQGGCPMKELRRRQTSCCQADSEGGSQGIHEPGPRHENSCLVLLIQSRTLGVSPCLWHGGTRQWHCWLPQGNTPAVSTLAWEVNKFSWILPWKSLFFSSCLQEVLHCRSLQDWENYTFRGDGTGSPKGQ